MFRSLLLPGLLFALACPRAFLAQDTPPMPEHEHHHNHAPEPTEKLGHVVFPTSCSAASQPKVERGVALLHSFAYTIAQQQFETIAKDDPTCAMAHWGLAMTQFQELWGRPDDAQMRRGTEEMAKAHALAAPPARVTPREHAYIDALSAFFDPAPLLYEQRATAYEAKMNALHRDFPDDVEGAAFDALSMLASIRPEDTSLSHEHQALAILLPLFAQHPDHPGLAHYIIHTCDTPALAREGLPAAREYAAIAPSSPHALHMPGHIFARLGMWPEDIQSNLASVHASEQDIAAGRPGGAHQMHADEFLIYAYLQTGEDARAKALTAEMPAVGRHMAAMPGMDDMKDAGPYFTNELNAVYDLEMHDWQAAAALQPTPNSPATSTLDTWWARGIAAGHLQNPGLAAGAVTGMDQTFAALKQAKMVGYLQGSAKVKHQEVLAWQAYAQHHPDQAVATMREAANLQDKLGQDEVDIPAREMLGDLLLLEHKPSEALAEYQVALQLSPHRLNGLLSAGQAAEQAGHPDQARAFFQAAAQQTDKGLHSTRPELAHAVQVAGSSVTASR